MNLFYNRIIEKMAADTYQTPWLKRILAFKDQQGRDMLTKYSVEEVIKLLQKQHFEALDKCTGRQTEGFNLLEFVRFFMNIIDHEEINNLFLAVGIIDFFREVCVFSQSDKVYLKDVTGYMCQRILEEGRPAGTLMARRGPGIQRIVPSQETKSFVSNPPGVCGCQSKSTHKLSFLNMKTDKNKHTTMVKEYFIVQNRSQFSFDLKMVFMLDCLSDQISVYDTACNSIKTLTPAASRLKKDTIIISFKFSVRQFRVGAVLQNFSISFWDHASNFQYEKTINTAIHCQNLQSGIYFLQGINKWITSDRCGILSFWDLSTDIPNYRINCIYDSAISDLCEIPSLNLIAVAQENTKSDFQTEGAYKRKKEGQKIIGNEYSVVVYHAYKGQIVGHINMEQARIPHSMRFSDQYQVLITGGLEKKMKVFQLHPRFLDVQLKGELAGHQNMVTSFILLEIAPLLLSNDDKGKVKLWNFQQFSCIQTIDFSGKTIITNLLDMSQVGRIGVLGSRINFLQFQNKAEIIKVQRQDASIQSLGFDQDLAELYAFSQQEVKVLDLHSGSTKRILKIIGASTITHFKYIQCLKKFMIGNSKGQILVYDLHTGAQTAKIGPLHKGAVSFLDYDELNKLIITAGSDSSIVIYQWAVNKVLRELRNNFNGQEIAVVHLSVYHNLVVISCKSNTLYAWNYQFGKLVMQLQLPEEHQPTAIQIINGYGLLLVGSNKGFLFMFMLSQSSVTSVSRNFNYTFQGPIEQLASQVSILQKDSAASLERCDCLVRLENGCIYKIQLSNILAEFVFVPHSKRRTNYNPFRQCKQNFNLEIEKGKLETHIFQLKQSEMLSCEDIKPKKLGTDGCITFMKTVRLQDCFLLTVSNKKRIKIYSLNQGALIADININFPLPYLWKFNPINLRQAISRISYGIKIINSIIQKYGSQAHVSEIKLIGISKLLTILKNAEEATPGNQSLMLTEPAEQLGYNGEMSAAKPLLLQEEYEKSDMNFQLIKKFHFKRIAGPTLKQYDRDKKMMQTQKAFLEQERKQRAEKDQLLRVIRMRAHKLEEKDSICSLLSSRPFKKRRVNKQNQRIIGFQRRLDEIINEEHFSSKTIPLHKPTSSKEGTRKEREDTKRESQIKDKKSFEDYFAEKYPRNHKRQPKFQTILAEINERVKTCKKSGRIRY